MHTSIRILVDHCVAAKVVAVASERMPTAEFVKARDVSAHELNNGDLHAFAEREGFDKIPTADLNMTVQTVPRLPTVVYHLRSGMTDAELRDIAEDCADLLNVAEEVRYHPVKPREGSTRYAARLTRASKVEKYRLRPTRKKGVVDL